MTDRPVAGGEAVLALIAALDIALVDHDLVTGCAQAHM